MEIVNIATMEILLLKVIIYGGKKKVINIISEVAKKVIIYENELYLWAYVNLGTPLRIVGVMYVNVRLIDASM